ncbi:family 43 glycoside hydrolase [Melampsora larici-populina 98AG31]|uniref:arabinan endo-1,5-alpha-L-arabinosidase n=1 Tax=Melampsora larici-populina (strain 98AG31 / pathotype 3-4-7) TaxID=747676 RepID=F4R742_MELLP|nr:family 43 glycoside hydrolase [Melampsora larici-populina 98AG31]EGG11518.1 family 43 glycoside hydrolase [Melampsora larici-populina 98AG31]
MLNQCCIFFTLLFSFVYAAYPSPGPCSGQCWAHDPSLIRRKDGTWFRFNTGNKIGIWKSRSLSGPWEYAGDAFREGSSIPIKGNDFLWAPDVQFIDSKYYMTYSVSIFGSKNSAIGVATSPDMEPGSWTDLGSTALQSSEITPYNAIDSSTIMAGSGDHCLMTFGSFAGGIFQVPLSNPPTKIESNGKIKKLAHNTHGSPTGEGSYMFHHRGYYYLLYSVGRCCGYNEKMPARGEEYRIVMCRSKSPSSGFVNMKGADCAEHGGSTLLASHGDVYGPGGQCHNHEIWAIIALLPLCKSKDKNDGW